MRVLIAEDDATAARYMARGLAQSGHVVDCAGDGDTALAMAEEGIYDALVLDRRLPGLDGLDVVRRLRLGGIRTSVLMLSALAATADRIEGMRAGADAYLAKPYAFAELLARLEALVRLADRAQGERKLQVGDLELDTAARAATRAGRAIVLQRREFLLLEHLARHAGHVVTRSMLLQAAWPYDFEPRSSVVDIHIHRLRQKLDAGFAVAMIQTVAGVGYRLTAGE